MDKNIIIISLSAVGSFIGAFFGGMTLILKFLLMLMLIDYLTGMIVAARGLSTKSTNGKLSSKAGFDGLMRKLMIIIWVLIGHYADFTFGWNIIANGIMFAYMANELISIMENSMAMGVPVPSVISRMIESLKEKSDA